MGGLRKAVLLGALVSGLGMGAQFQIVNRPGSGIPILRREGVVRGEKHNHAMPRMNEIQRKEGAWGGAVGAEKKRLADEKRGRKRLKRIEWVGGMMLEGRMKTVTDGVGFGFCWKSL